jgi:hypothetical protein
MINKWQVLYIQKIIIKNNYAKGTFKKWLIMERTWKDQSKFKIILWNNNSLLSSTLVVPVSHV